MSNIYKLLNSRYGKPSGLTRREMFQRSFAAGAALLISERFTAPLGAGAGRVVVVGAGFSGLAAAYELSRAGYEVTVVEARNRRLVAKGQERLDVEAEVDRRLRELGSS